MVFEGAGILRGGDGGELARAEPLPSPALARIIVGAESYVIEKPSALGWHFQLLDGGAGIVYDFRPGLRRGGTLYDGAGAEVAALHKSLIGTHWTIAPSGGEPVEVKRREGLAGPQVSDDGRIVAPDLDLGAPESLPLGKDLSRLLAFCCWLIEEWDAREPF